MLMVADMRMRRRSGRSATNVRKTPRRKSQWRCLSWTSSTITTWYWASVLSCWICRSNSPSVRNNSLVAVVRVVSKRIWCPTCNILIDIGRFYSCILSYTLYNKQLHYWMWSVITNLWAKLIKTLEANPLCKGYAGDTSRLSAGYVAETSRQKILRYLGGFPTACVPGHHHNGVKSYQLHDLVPVLEDGQIFLVSAELGQFGKTLPLGEVQKM